LATGPTAARRGCAFTCKDSYTTDTLISVLEQLGRFYAGQRVVLLWDGLSALERGHAGLAGQSA
jgi:hypothetical protein